MKVYRIKTYYDGMLVGVQYTENEKFAKTIEQNEYSFGIAYDIYVDEFDLKENENERD